MNRYDPEAAPHPDEWLSLSEGERSGLVEDYHLEAGEPEPDGGFHLHALFHVIVENQIAEREQTVCNAIRRLTDQGFSRHDALHAVAAVQSEEIFEVLQGGNLNVKRQKRRLDKLTAKRVLKGKW